MPLGWRVTTERVLAVGKQRGGARGETRPRNSATRLEVWGRETGEMWKRGGGVECAHRPNERVAVVFPHPAGRRSAWKPPWLGVNGAGGRTGCSNLEV